MVQRVTLFLASFATLALIHVVSTKFFLYWKYTWLDIPVHLFGGSIVALGISILPFFRIELPKFFETMFGYVCLVIFVGIIWELFEYISGTSVYDEAFFGDTALDFCMDALGAVIGYGIVRSLKRFE